ncbi:polyketide synthase [Apiospora phragmitis]|uniref:Polyketide synthase n=1 Tax=Apiospora phragmitis TaxID=2905665 RepID=A0ABR1T6W3_9PEZI
MGAELIDKNAVFRQSIRRLERFLKGLPTPVPWSIEDELRKGRDESRVHKAEMSHPLTIAVQIGLRKRNSSSRHGRGYLPGTTSSDNEGEAESKRGTMAAIGLGRHDMQPLTEPGSSVTISRDAEKVESVVRKVKEYHIGALARLLRVEKAFHSHHMIHYGASYEEHIKPFMNSISPKVQFYSSVTEASHWAEPRVAREWRFRQDPPYELLGSRVVVVSNEGCWRNKLSLGHVLWLSGHKVNGQTIFPAAGYIAMLFTVSAYRGLGRDFRRPKDRGRNLYPRARVPCGRSGVWDDENRIVLQVKGFKATALTNISHDEKVLLISSIEWRPHGDLVLLDKYMRPREKSAKEWHMLEELTLLCVLDH